MKVYVLADSSTDGAAVSVFKTRKLALEKCQSLVDSYIEDGYSILFDSDEYGPIRHIDMTYEDPIAEEEEDRYRCTVIDLWESKVVE